MSYNATGNSAGRRIATLLDEEALLRSAAQLLPEAQISTCRKKKLRLMVLLPVME